MSVFLLGIVLSCSIEENEVGFSVVEVFCYFFVLIVVGFSLEFIALFKVGLRCSRDFWQDISLGFSRFC